MKIYKITSNLIIRYANDDPHQLEGLQQTTKNYKEVVRNIIPIKSYLGNDRLLDIAYTFKLRISAQIGPIFEYKYSRKWISIIIEISLFLGSLLECFSFDFTVKNLFVVLIEKWILR